MCAFSPNNCRVPPPDLRTPAHLTYAFADSTIAPGIEIGDCQVVEAFDPKLVDGSSREQAIQEVEIGLKVWESVANVQLTRAKSLQDAAIIIGMAPKSSTITHAFVGLSRGPFENSQILSLGKATLCLEPEELWTTQRQHRIEGKDKFLSLQLIAAHEAGHILGLDHTSDNTQMMRKSIREEITGLGAGDLYGIQLLYGPSPMLPVPTSNPSMTTPSL